MLQITRRDSIKLASATGLASLLSGGSDARAVEPVKGELMLMGPFPLGELYESQKRSLGNEHTDGQGPTDEDIAKAFNQCQLYVIDKKVIAKAGEWRFADEEYPRMALSGEVHFELKDNKDADFKIYFEKIVKVDQRDDYVTKPATRSFIVGFQSYIVRGNLGSEKHVATYGWSAKKRIAYDINGKLLTKKP
jgi:hypothetical protein